MPSVTNLNYTITSLKWQISGREYHRLSTTKFQSQKWTKRKVKCQKIIFKVNVMNVI